MTLSADQELLEALRTLLLTYPSLDNRDEQADLAKEAISLFNSTLALDSELLANVIDDVAEMASTRELRELIWFLIDQGLTKAGKIRPDGRARLLNQQALLSTSVQGVNNAETRLRDALNTKGVSEETYSLVRLNLANLLYRRGELDKAKAQLNAITTESPQLLGAAKQLRARMDPVEPAPLVKLTSDPEAELMQDGFDVPVASEDDPNIALEAEMLRWLSQFDSAMDKNAALEAREAIDQLEKLSLVANYFATPEVDFNVSFVFAMATFEYVSDKGISEVRSALEAAAYAAELAGELYQKNHPGRLQAEVLASAGQLAVASIGRRPELGEARRTYARNLTRASRVLRSSDPFLRRARVWEERFGQPSHLKMYDVASSVTPAAPPPAVAGRTVHPVIFPPIASKLAAPAVEVGRAELLNMSTSEIVALFGAHAKDVGRAEVQIALLTKRIFAISDHLATNKHDHATRRGLLKLVGKRRAMLNHLLRINPVRYRDILLQLGLRR